MDVAVVGLGVEGIYALQSLLRYGHRVYASDLNIDLEISIDNFENMYEIDLGDHNWDKINEQDAVVISPSLWKDNILKHVKNKDKIFSNVFKDHREIFTIGVTGTNGKTTTSLMIRDILESTGNKVLVGGNAGGGFSGYTELMLKASQETLDFLVVEICDMTLDFSSYNFNFDIMVVTNLGYDHMNVHKNMVNYQKNIGNIIKNKKAVLNKNDPLLIQLNNKPAESHLFDTYCEELNLVGKFNRENAAAAFKVGELLKIPPKVIKGSLKSFKAVDGRITQLNMKGTNFLIGKTDNISALKPILREYNFDLIVLGTPRKKEKWRFEIFQELSDFDINNIILFPGLDDTTHTAEEILLQNKFNGKVLIKNEVEDIVTYLLNHLNEFNSVFIGGNGQAKILEIKNKLENFSSAP